MPTFTHSFRPSRRFAWHTLYSLVAATALFAVTSSVHGEDSGSFRVTKRSRVVAESGVSVKSAREEWPAEKTAVIICDVWDQHWCKGATRRGGEMAPRIDAFVKEARKRGSTIVHAPSGCMKAYENHPSRKRAQSIPPAKTFPAEIGKWCHKIPEESKGKYPLDQSDGGCDCQPMCKSFGAWKKQLERIEIDEGPSDFISDSGKEIWSIFEERDIDNVFMVGVHTNMCVLGRPFGLRNLSRYGKNVVLVRDLTDTMYNPRSWPHVSHFRGTDLIVEHIEKFVCPTVTSADVLGGEAFRFRLDPRAKIAVVIAEREYFTWETLPPFVSELERRFGHEVSIVRAKSNQGAGRNFVPGLRDALADADLLLLSMRRRALPEDDVAAVKAHLLQGKPLVAIRTSSHAFDTKGKHPEGHAEWRDFDPKVLGGNYSGHHGNGPLTTVTLAEGAGKHPILAGVRLPLTSTGSLYKASPLAKGTTLLLTGSIPDKASQPVAWTNRYGRAPIFYTSLGHKTDFENDSFRRLLSNAIGWALREYRTQHHEKKLRPEK